MISMKGTQCEEGAAAFGDIGKCQWLWCWGGVDSEADAINTAVGNF